jgi:ABC-2 type transport system permease protein
MMSKVFANFGRYFMFICKRERVSSPIWLASCVCVFAGMAALYPRFMTDEASSAALAAMMDTPAMVAMMGPAYGTDIYTPAIAMASQCLVWYLLAIAVMNIFLVNRHTRADEERGRLEMLIALPVGRLTGSLSTLAFAFALNFAISAITALSLIIMNIEGTSVAGALTFSFVIGAVGFLFAGLTLLFAQLFSTKAAVSGAGMAALGLFYILRASGDVSGDALSLISPLGLALKTEAFYANNLAPLFMLIAEGIIFSVAALFINAIRDHGSGIIHASKGEGSREQISGLTSGSCMEAHSSCLHMVGNFAVYRGGDVRFCRGRYRPVREQ